MNVEVFR